MNLTTYHFLFTAMVVTPLELDEHSGSALRGNLFEAVWKRFCTNKDAPTCADCPLHDLCPVSALVAPLREEHIRGRDIPRPYVILPPLERARLYTPGETLSFGITLFGSIIELLPYLMLSVSALEAAGLGKRVQGQQRGTFRIKQVEAYHPFTGERQVVYAQGKPLVKTSTLAITVADVQARAQLLATEKLTLTFLTPLRLKDQAQRVQHLAFRPLFQRAMERVIDLEQAYGSGEKPWSEERADWLERAEMIQCVEDTTHWEEVQSYSRRTQQQSPIGGLMGSVTFVGDLTHFREILVWGQLTHIGKNCVKGNGWYQIGDLERNT